MSVLQKTTDIDKTPYIGMDLNGDGVIETIATLPVDETGKPLFTPSRPGTVVIKDNPTFQAILQSVLESLQNGLSLNGSLTTVTHTTATVTTATGAALAANANRKYALVVNDSDTVIYIKIGADAAANQGIRLNADGGSFEMSHALGNLNTGAINAIHAGSGNKTLLVTEGV